MTHKRSTSSDHAGVQLTSTLTIPSVSLSDTGNITCEAANEAGVNSSTMHLQVIGKSFVIPSVWGRMWFKSL